ncbi:uncharacterized protein N7496_009034 [Penicillium cataractarum]|uniref:FAD-binding FR-type domain-containing protein n=1 Tax=Penicillium cataractarum TaxID=2100454 RepID=A0A9W9S283_9EURO|nr:uncharacterized protein N7496_009034 [Penicillium cataractarum]KAJ5369274.1 hypothetical protein N7496_009034 [Penicillium cataractarum]
MAITALHGWHPGELAIQRKLGFADAVRDHWSIVGNFMPAQHRIFHTSNLPFIPVTIQDDHGRPWASIVSGLTGSVGFVKSPDARTLSVLARLWEGDPLLDAIRTWKSLKGRDHITSEKFLTAGLGIEFSTRRRNKFAGHIRGVQQVSEFDYEIDLAVTETIGNCPKYINIRKLDPYPHTRPVVAYRNQQLSPHEKLPDEVVDFILQADTAFIASFYKSEKRTADMYPSHAGMNARSGLPGFMRVRPSDGRTVVIPDYSGNRLVTSLGNIESSGLAGLTIVSFTTGDILYLTGTAENHVGPAALKIMARHASLTTVKVTGYTLVKNALPVRQQPRTSVERSPYSPKIKYLVEETESETSDYEGHQAYLQEAVQLSFDLAVFKFKVATKPGASGINIRPGQAIVLDFMDWMGPPRYQHMANSAPESINDDRVRTWTVSSAHEGQNMTSFELTMRKMPGGAVTGALFDALKNHPLTRWGQPIKFDNSVRAGIVGITGDFSLSPEKVNELWVAGGIGITPFIAMLQALGERGPAAQGNISLVLATREPEIMLQLIQPSLAKMPPTVKVELEIFTNDFDFDTRVINSPNVKVTLHQGRVKPAFWATVPKDNKFFICGPNSFGDSVVNGLQAAGVQPSQIHREGFY